VKRVCACRRTAGVVIFGMGLIASLLGGGGVASAQVIRTHASTTQRSQVSSAPVSSNTNSFDIVRIGAALIGVVSLIFLLQWGAKGLLGNKPGSRASGAISVVARSNIAPRQQLLLVQVGRRLVLVGNTGAAMNALCEINEAGEVSELLGKLATEKSGSIARTFGMLFGKEESKFSGDGTDAVEREETEEEHHPVGLARREVNGLMETVRGLANSVK